MPFKRCPNCRKSLQIGGHNFKRKWESRGLGLEGFEDICIRCSDRKKAKVEEKVKIPTSRSTYLFPKMKVNDSFFIDANGEPRTVVANRIRTASVRYRDKNKGTNFSIHEVEGGVRCWRTA